MTRNEARMIAEEMIPLMRKEIKRIVENVLDKESKNNDEFLDFEEASKLTSLPIAWLKRHREELPHTVKGRKIVFSKLALIQYMNR